MVLMKTMGNRRGHLLRIVAAAVLVGLWWVFSSSELSYTKPEIDYKGDGPRVQNQGQPKSTNAVSVTGAIMPLMPDQEAKKELGRASWKYFHTLLARFPDEPTEEQRSKLNNFIHLYAELYPCGECSHHFVKMLETNPPQTSSRVAAAMWGCHIHNIVNEKLKKPTYDCSTILEDYDCGCGDGEGKIRDSLKLNKVSMQKEGQQGG
ncbi:hypothetical protein ZYGR_0BA00920 [Zygosaccharomyces rouxii]|uniref:Sulfhydryl oxidase n=1 Tax=Zygosaccharomyces rouxii TaxID=4956 RepID=A0A1Q3AK98_ZYGRO|nr:hypothetical protein ZYGR_0BA00920 [Zygosaccharomyces rouxii]